MMKHLPALACILFSLPVFSQGPPPDHYPQGYFRDPLDIPISLAANFGELRPNHYHMGLDIRTQKKVNLPVHAAADGYIAHIKIEPEGFGQAIYINHPNGYTTLYAHLNRFFPALAAYVKQQQYKMRSWQVSLDIPPGMFPVRKGDLIAYSGSTGGSQGPHLHFEIRQTAGDINLNPLLFGLPVPDNVPPVIQRLALYDRDRSLYEQAPRIFPVHRSPSPPSSGNTATFSLGQPLISVDVPRISFAISTFDSQSGSANPNGIFQATIHEDGQPLAGFRMDRISYEYTRNINAHIDYATREKGGPWLEHLSRLPGYGAPSIYLPFLPDLVGNGDGVIDLHDGAVHLIRIEVKDANANGSVLAFRVQYARPSGGKDSAIMLPDTTGLSGKTVYPNMLDGLETGDCAFYIPEKGVYDLAWIRLVRSDPGESASSENRSTMTATPAVYTSPRYTIGDPSIPLQDPMLVRIRAGNDLPDSSRDRVVMVRTSRGERDLQRPEWQGRWASARFREFGDFRLMEDRVPPVIEPLGFRDGAVLSKAGGIAFKVKDNLGGVHAFRAELDPSAGGEGQWLCFTNDKGRAFIYTFDEHCPRGRHVLKVTVQDAAGNSTTSIYHFTR
ncbi:MAG: M23 family metallopeptidase [Bacteroidota bacterium]|nr:M23 family metallopeptidase [Bacteroidota bacterium]